MPAKIATAEELQSEIRTLWAMTEEESPSRGKLASAISDLASRVAGDDHIELVKQLSKDLVKVDKDYDTYQQSLGDAIRQCQKVRTTRGVDPEVVKTANVLLKELEGLANQAMRDRGLITTVQSIAQDLSEGRESM
jgi:hypothetical protein